MGWHASTHIIFILISAHVLISAHPPFWYPKKPSRIQKKAVISLIIDRFSCANYRWKAHEELYLASLYAHSAVIRTNTLHAVMFKNLSRGLISIDWAQKCTQPLLTNKISTVTGLGIVLDLELCDANALRSLDSQPNSWFALYKHRNTALPVITTYWHGLLIIPMRKMLSPDSSLMVMGRRKTVSEPPIGACKRLSCWVTNAVS